MSLLKKISRQNRRKIRVRSKITGTEKRPRLTVFRSLRAINAQLIDDEKGITLVSASSLHQKKSSTIESAQEVGKAIATAAKAKKITNCVFDRGSYRYHGRVKALAEGARKEGLTF